jgi:hypothetical protein
VGGDRVGEGRARLVPRLLDEPLSLRVLVEDEVEAALEDLGGGRAGAGVRERVLRGLELLEQPAGDGDVQARELRVERLDLVARGPAEARTRTGAATSSGEVTRTRTGVATSLVKLSAARTTVHSGRNLTRRKSEGFGAD